MKYLSIFLGLLMLSLPAYADGPVTSSDFFGQGNSNVKIDTTTHQYTPPPQSTIQNYNRSTLPQRAPAVNTNSSASPESLSEYATGVMIQTTAQSLINGYWRGVQQQAQEEKNKRRAEKLEAIQNKQTGLDKNRENFKRADYLDNKTKSNTRYSPVSSPEEQNVPQKTDYRGVNTLFEEGNIPPEKVVHPPNPEIDINIRKNDDGSKVRVFNPNSKEEIRIRELEADYAAYTEYMNQKAREINAKSLAESAQSNIPKEVRKKNDEFAIELYRSDYLEKCPNLTIFKNMSTPAGELEMLDYIKFQTRVNKKIRFELEEKGYKENLSKDKIEQMISDRQTRARKNYCIIHRDVKKYFDQLEKLEKQR